MKQLTRGKNFAYVIYRLPSQYSFVKGSLLSDIWVKKKRGTRKGEDNPSDSLELNLLREERNKQGTLNHDVILSFFFNQLWLKGHGARCNRIKLVSIRGSDRSCNFLKYIPNILCSGTISTKKSV